MPVYELHFTREQKAFVRVPAHPTKELRIAIQEELDRLNADDASPPWGCVVRRDSDKLATHIIARDGKLESLRDFAPPAPTPPPRSNDCVECGAGPSMCCKHRLRRHCPGCQNCN